MTEVKNTDRGKVIIFTGEGEEKTNVTIGMAYHTLAEGGDVIFAPFIATEHSIFPKAEHLPVCGGKLRTICIKGKRSDFLNQRDDFTEIVDSAGVALDMIYSLWLSECALLILDGIDRHLHCGGIDSNKVLDLIKDKPLSTTIILTGKSIPEKIKKKADSVIEFVNIKSPHEKLCC